MEFPMPKNPSISRVVRTSSFGGFCKPARKETPLVMESSNSTENMDLNVEEINSFDDGNNDGHGMNETEESVDPEGNVACTPINSTRGADDETNDGSSPTFKEEIDMLYNFVPEIANHFIIIKMIGEGTFSSVFLAKLRHHPEIDQLFALKHIIPTSSPNRIENELQCLLDIGGQDNVMGVKMCVRNRDHVIVVMPYFAHEKFQDYLFQMSVDEARDYMKNLLIALRRVHQFNIIHRDVKPSNFLYNRVTRQYALVDFGLATGPSLSDPAKPKNRISSTVLKSGSHNRSSSREPLSPSKKEAGERNFSNITKVATPLRPNASNKKGAPLSGARMFAPSFSSASILDRQSSGLCSCFGKPVICELCVARNIQIAPRAGTAGFRSPEVLLKSPDQTTAVDVWAAGVIFLSLLSARYPFFKATDDLGFLAQIISLVGTEPCIKAARSFGKLLTLSENIPPADFEIACKKLRSTQMTVRSISTPDDAVDSWSDISTDAYDLLGRLLDPNPKTRISADAALNHPFFTAVPCDKQADTDTTKEEMS